MLPLMRSSMTESVSESVCIGSPRARRPLVVWLRFAASRLGRSRSRGAVYLLSHRLSVRRGLGLLAGARRGGGRPDARRATVGTATPTAGRRAIRDRISQVRQERKRYGSGRQQHTMPALARVVEVE